MNEKRDIVKLIKDLGFPIVVAVGLAYTTYNQSENYRKDSLVREEKYYKQIQGFQETMGNFNETLQTMNLRLEKIESREN